MRYLTKIMAFSGIVLLFGGCLGTSSVEKKYSYDNNKRHIVEYDKETYYYRPDNSWSHRLDANTAHLNSVASGGLLACEEDDIWFISLNDRSDEGKIRYRYFISLAKFQLMDMEDDSDYIPRDDSKEFQDLIEIDTRMASQGLIGCSKKLSKQEIAKIKRK